MNLYSKIDELIKNNKPFVMCVVICTKGSTPRKAGSKMLVFPDGSIVGSIGGGSVEKEVTGIALKMMGTTNPVKHQFNLEDDLGMHCGGYMEVYIEPVNPMQKLFIFGAGHIGKALSRYAPDFGFDITLVDPREHIFDDPVFARCRCINKDYFEAIVEEAFGPESYVVIVTPKHAFDEGILEKVAVKPHSYIGMIGSTRKVALLKKRFLEENILTQEQLDSIDMPIGIKFEAETPEEIAISILAKLIDVRNRKHGFKK